MNAGDAKRAEETPCHIDGTPHGLRDQGQQGHPSSHARPGDISPLKLARELLDDHGLGAACVFALDDQRNPVSAWRLRLEPHWNVGVGEGHDHARSQVEARRAL